MGRPWGRSWGSLCSWHLGVRWRGRLGRLLGAEASAGPVCSRGSPTALRSPWGPGLRGARPRAAELAWQTLTMDLTVGTEQGKGEALSLVVRGGPGTRRH